MTTLVKAPIGAIDHNPFRNTDKYPFVERKLEALGRSIDAVGLWEGIIARRSGNRYELAFGHHRYEAAKRAGLTSVTLIIRDLDDEHMLQFMGRENMEDYNADFLTMLETWDAAWNWVKSRAFKDPQPIEVTRLLGWTAGRGVVDGDQMNRTAVACNSAHRLIAGGHVSRADLVDLTVNEAREICTRATANIERIEKAGKAMHTPAAAIEASKKAVAKAVKETAKESRAGGVSQADLRGRVDLNAYKAANSTGKVKESPLFAVFAKQLTDQLYRMLRTDVAAEKLEEIISSIKEIGPDGDWSMVGMLKHDLNGVIERAKAFDERLQVPKAVRDINPDAENTVKLIAIEGGRR